MRPSLRPRSGEERCAVRSPWRAARQGLSRLPPVPRPARLHTVQSRCPTIVAATIPDCSSPPRPDERSVGQAHQPQPRPGEVVEPMATPAAVRFGSGAPHTGCPVRPGTFRLVGSSRNPAEPSFRRTRRSSPLGVSATGLVRQCYCPHAGLEHRRLAVGRPADPPSTSLWLDGSRVNWDSGRHGDEILVHGTLRQQRRVGRRYWRR
jgi:hypothetical protein